jgi:PEGA domain
MATESSAIVRFISSTQREQHTLEDEAAGLPDFSDDLQPIRRSYRLPLVVLAMVLFAAVAALAGVYVGKTYFGGSQPAAPTAAAPAPAAPPAPKVAAPEPAPALSAAVLAETGFDIRVKPQATISLDGRVLGKSPLRVRNLTPGAHVVDIEAPAGFFSRRVELELNAGEPQNVNLALDPIGDEVAEDNPAAAPAKAKKARGDTPRAKRKARRARAKARARARKAALARATSKDEADKPTGTLMIGSKPPCDIYIDGKSTGLKTPQRAIELSAGSHMVTLVNHEHDIKKSFKVKINSGKSTRAIHDLTGNI